MFSSELQTWSPLTQAHGKRISNTFSGFTLCEISTAFHKDIFLLSLWFPHYGYCRKKKQLRSLGQLHPRTLYNCKNLLKAEVVFSRSINLGHVIPRCCFHLHLSRLLVLLTNPTLYQHGSTTHTQFAHIAVTVLHPQPQTPAGLI